MGLVNSVEETLGLSQMVRTAAMRWDAVVEGSVVYVGRRGAYFN